MTQLAGTDRPAVPRSTDERIADLARRQERARAGGPARAVARQAARDRLTARERLDRLLDPGSFTEMDALVRARFGAHADGGDSRPYGDGVVTGFGTVDGRQVCVFAQDATVYGGSMGEAFGEKVVKTMDLAMKIGCPVVGLNDSGGARIQEGVASLALYAELVRRNVQASGVIPQISVIMGSGAAQEQGGIIRRGAKLLYAYAEATVPKVTVVIRKAYGGGYAVMGSKHLGADVNFAWPTARIAVMGAEGAVSVLHRRELAVATDPEGLRAKLIEEYEANWATPYLAAERGYVDAVIAPHTTRAHITRALRTLRTKRAAVPDRRHGNIPL